MQLSDSIYIKESNNQVIVIVDNTHTFTYCFDDNHPRRSDEYYIQNAINKC